MSTASGSMTAEARKALAKTIRGLREQLLADLHDAMEAEYRLGVADAKSADLDEARSARRRRLDDWIDTQMRGWKAPKAVAKDSAKRKAARAAERARVRRVIEKEVAWTFLNRLIVLRLLEAETPKTALVSGAYSSKSYKEYLSWAPALRQDEAEGFQLLLELVFQEQAGAMPGLFGEVGLESLVRLPVATLRHVLAELDKPALASCWTDDMTLGWVYQYWNDPEREALDAKINRGEKIEPHEIASKTQLFTERYMVDWLLQNSLGPMWFELCERHGWTPDILRPGADGKSPLDILEERRADWRAKRAAGEVEQTALMPLHNDLERRWAYYLPPATEAEGGAEGDEDEPDSPPRESSLPDSVRDWKILDPAVGSGHFLVVAFELLFALYEEEARHRGEEGQAQWTPRAVAERILSENLHGVDIDPRAVQIAAAALWLKARSKAPEARPERLNLVAANLRLGDLPEDDPALVELYETVEAETKIPQKLTKTIVKALQGADHLGSLLKVDTAIEETVRSYASTLPAKLKAAQGDLFTGHPDRQSEMNFDAAAARVDIETALEAFLARTTRAEELGLRLRGEQLAAGVRFLRVVREGAYDLIVANPPYQGTSKMKEASYLKKNYKAGKADLYAAFLLRGLELAKSGGLFGMLTMRNWMFIKQYVDLRESILNQNQLLALGDLDKGAFESMPTSQLISICMPILRRSQEQSTSIAIQPTAPGEKFWSRDRTDLKRAAVLVHRGRHDFQPEALRVVPEWPLVYWWGHAELELYRDFSLIGETSPARAAQSTGDNTWFARKRWEIEWDSMGACRYWRPLIKGAAGREWFEPFDDVVAWEPHGFPIKISKCAKTGVSTCGLANEEFYLQSLGAAFSAIGARFSARAHRFPSVFESMGSSIFPDDLPNMVCMLNSRKCRGLLQDINPSVHFQTGDINRIPSFLVSGSSAIWKTLEQSFDLHESHREPSIEFKQPGPSPWRHAQEWAQEAVDRPEGDPLPEYVEELDPEPATDHISFALGVALGRFGPAGEGILDPAKDDLSEALPDGIAFLDRSLESGESGDSLDHPAATALISAWSEHGPRIETRRNNLRDYLALDFFDGVHRKMYENRPIHWPLSSSDKTFVAWVTIHRWNADTLRRLQSEHLKPALNRLEGRLADLQQDRASPDTATARAAETAWNRLVGAKVELTNFIAAVTECAEKGPPQTDENCQTRETDARYAPCLDDGVMINSAALWPLLGPQWNRPKRWWTELAEAKGRKDYDWSRLAARYFPDRVDGKCKDDPSLAVAHGCFWSYHPELAYKWELRLKHELGPDFALHDEAEPGKPDKAAADQARLEFEREHPDTCMGLIRDEIKRREREYKKLCRRRDAGELFEDEVVPETFEPGVVLKDSALREIAPDLLAQLESELSQVYENFKVLP